jgi:glycosyltransferase involved in cell wall biosynthesis
MRDANGKPRILALNAYYLPGYKGGGSIRALVNLIGHLKEDFEFVVATDAHDLQEPEPYSARERGEVIASEGYEIHYFSGRWELMRGLHRLLKEPWDLLYLNSAFSPGYSILPLLLNRMKGRRKVPVVLAPRGEFIDDNLQSHASKLIKKRVFLGLARALGHYAGVCFQATSQEEAKGILALGLGENRITLAPDLPPKSSCAGSIWPAKTSGELRVVFVSRIVPGKNLHFALEVLRGVQAPVNFDIVGPIGDEAYWAGCQRIMATLPGHIRVRHLGPVPHTEILQVFASHDLFLFPTQAENNGYVILEALLAGCPVLLSDRTPWRGLRELGVGWDLPLENPAAFGAALDELAALSSEEHNALRERAQAYGRDRLLAAEDVAATRAMFREAMG